MNKSCFLLLVLCCGGLIGRAQNGSSPASEGRFYMQHAILLHAGGAALGVGPGYELQLSTRKGLTIAPGLSLPLVHSTWHNRYSPLSFSPSVNVMWGRRHWRMELSTEYNYFVEWGQNPGGSLTAYTTHNVALMPGVRRQVAGGGLIFRANLGAKVVEIGNGPELLPAATLSIGYAFPNKAARTAAIPPKPTWHFGNRVPESKGDSSGRRTFQIQVAPKASIGLQRQFHHQRNVPLPTDDPKYTFQFKTRWAACVGAVADLGNANAIAGVRLGFEIGLQRVQLDWSSLMTISGAISNDYRSGHEVNIDDLRLTMGLNACIRLRTASTQPWVFQFGMLAGETHTLTRNSFLIMKNRKYKFEGQHTLGFGMGPKVSFSKQWTCGKYRVEPFWDAQCSIRRIVKDPDLYQYQTSVGFLFWF